jgi:type IV pilus assembly protein PilE
MKSRRRACPQGGKGFTLIELMVTVTIVAILAGIAIPSYRNYVLRGQITNATTGLSAMQANMERYFQDNRTYAPTAGGLQPPCTPPGATNGTFTITCPAVPTGTTFALQAVGSGSTAGFTYFLDNTGAQRSTAVAPAPNSWKGCAIAWETKAGQCP